MEWQPIDTAPKDGVRVLLVDAYGNVDIADYEEEIEERFVLTDPGKKSYEKVREIVGYWNTENVFNPTHWMPLPDPPKENSNG